jgi:hypothetical protein
VPRLTVFLMLAAGLASAGSAASAADRIVSTLPGGEPDLRETRMLSTRPLRQASEAQLLRELARQAEIDRAIDARLVHSAGGLAVFPGVYPQWPVSRPPCAGPRCDTPGARPWHGR